MQTTAPLPFGGDTATTQVPFGDGEFTLVAAARADGSLERTLRLSLR